MKLKMNLEWQLGNISKHLAILDAMRAKYLILQEHPNIKEHFACPLCIYNDTQSCSYCFGYWHCPGMDIKPYDQRIKIIDELKTYMLDCRKELEGTKKCL